MGKVTWNEKRTRKDPERDFLGDNRRYLIRDVTYINVHYWKK